MSGRELTDLPFEKKLAELRDRIAALREANDDGELDNELDQLQGRYEARLEDLFGKLDAWQTVLVSRHMGRPRAEQFIAAMFDGFEPLAGDRRQGDDPAIAAGIGAFRGRSVAIVAHRKGYDTQSNLARNFGMARPEGYRKAQRVMELADRFGLPVVCLVDTAGAYPGKDAEDHGQAEAIAQSMAVSLRLRVPMVSVIVGEGGSGGAVALATADRVLMMQHAIYSVISPEGCSSILWRDKNHAAAAATALQLRAPDLLRLGIVDRVIAEPLGGAHRDPEAAVLSVVDAIDEELLFLEGIAADRLVASRIERYRTYAG